MRRARGAKYSSRLICIWACPWDSTHPLRRREVSRRRRGVSCHWHSPPTPTSGCRVFESCHANAQKCMESGRFYVRGVRTLQGTWIPVHELPTETLMFRGEVKGFHQVKTKGGAGYFFCSPETGGLVAYLLMK